MIAEIQDAPLVTRRRDYKSSEFYNQPGWSTRAARLAEVIHKFDRGDVPDAAGNIGCFASLERLASETGAPRSTTSRWLRWLKNEGVLVELGSSASGIVYRRIVLKWDVRERVGCRRIISTFANGLLTHRRLKKSELPAPVFYGPNREGGVLTDGNRKGSLYELRTNPVVPFRDEKIISDSKPNPGNEATPRPTEASSVRAPYTRRDKVLALTEVVALLKDHFPVEKQNEKSLAMFWRRWRKGSINLHTLALALRAKDMLCESDDQVREVNDFHHFICKFDELVSKSVSDWRTSAKSKLREALMYLGYPESRPKLEDGEPLSDVDYGVVCQWTEDELNLMLRGSAEMVDLDRLAEMVCVNSFNLLRRKFAEMRTCLNLPEEVAI